MNQERLGIRFVSVINNIIPYYTHRARERAPSAFVLGLCEVVLLFATTKFVDICWIGKFYLWVRPSFTIVYHCLHLGQIWK